MRAMKVLVLAPSLKAMGGVQSYTKTLAAGLEEILGHSQVRMVPVPGEPALKKDGSSALPWSVKAIFFLRALATAMLWRPNLVICTHLGVAPVAQIIEKYCGIRYWLVLHGIEVWGELPTPKYRALRGAQCYVALTRFTLNATAARHALGKPAAILLPPPLASVHGSDAAASSSSVGAVVLTVGRLAAAERYKGHDVMLETWPAVIQAVPDAEYWIVGDGDDRTRLESRAKALGIVDSVRFMGALSGDKLNAAYDSCRVFAMPARTVLNGDSPQGEGFGIVYIEAMSHGRPVVGPRTGAPAEFIRSGEHGFLVDPSNQAEIAQALIDLLTDRNRAGQMGKNAREWVNQEFTRENFLRRIADALQKNWS
jgi:phosphatidyl-myo-inositol dimannoside synthase